MATVINQENGGLPGHEAMLLHHAYEVFGFHSVRYCEGKIVVIRSLRTSSGFPHNFSASPTDEQCIATVLRDQNAPHIPQLDITY